MKITVDNADFARELNLLEKVVGKKPTISVLANVLIQAVVGGLKLSATDLEIGLVGFCAADVIEPGAVTLPVKKLMEIVRAQSDTSLTLVSDARGAVKFSSGKFNSKLQSLPAADFPGIPSNDGHPSIQLPRAPLKDMLSQIRYSISEKDTRFYLKGACMVLEEGQLTFVTTDGARLSVTSTKRDGPAWEPSLVPGKALDELDALLGEPGNTDITFSRSERHLFFDLDGRLLISRLIDAKFPAWKRIIPTQNEFQMLIDRQSAIAVLKRLILIDDIVLLHLDTGSLTITSVGVAVGEGDEEVPVTYQGPKVELRFKGQYLLDFLGAAKGEKIVLAVKDSANPGLFVDGDYLNVVMGMKV